MLRGHRNLLLPETERLKVGDAIVDISRREVVLPGGATTRLTLKAQQVLLLLVSRHRRVVSREDILEWVWPDTMPTNDVVTQAVTQLRRAFSDDVAAPTYVETIAKTGYRLIAPVAWLQDEPTASGSPVPGSGDAQSRHPWREKPWLGATLGAGAVSGLVALAILAGRSEDIPAEKDPAGAITGTVESALVVRNLTSGPEVEWGPRLSPDGSMVVYVARDPDVEDARARILIQASALTTARQLTVPGEDESDGMPVWSPDGRYIAFKRWNDEQCQLMLVPASGGVERPVGECANIGFFDWTADGTGLIASTSVVDPNGLASALRILHIESGEWRELAYERTPGDVDLEPRYSPDGKWIGFRRNFSLTDLWKVPADGGKPVRLSRLESDIRGWDWTPDGEAIVFSLNERRRSGLHRLDVATGEIASLGVERATMPDVAAHVSTVVFEVDEAKTSLYRYRLTAEEGAPFRRERVFPSSGSDMLPAVSPDGRNLAYLSDRSGDLQLWVGDLAHPKALRPIENLLPIARHPPVWSPDSRQLLVIGHDRERPWLYEVDIITSRVTRVDLSGAIPVYAHYLQGGDRLVGVDEGGGQLQLRRYRPGIRSWKPTSRMPDVSAVRQDGKGGKLYFSRVGKSGLWRMDPDFSRVEQVSSTTPTVLAYKAWVVHEGAVWVVGMRKGCALWWEPLLAEPATGQAGCLEKETSAPVAPSISPDGAWIYAWSDDDSNMDIGWAKLPVKESASVSVSAKKPER